MKRPMYLLLAAALTSCTTKQSEIPQFQNGTVWLDTDGNPIEAHAGGILKVDSNYYWYGENHAKGAGNQIGVSCYSSTDLISWKNEGVVFPKDSLPVAFHDSGVCERPKVVYNKKTKKYVMWMHLDGRGYSIASAGVAVSDSPVGQFRFLGHKRPVKYAYNGIANSPHPLSESQLGNSFRDMALFVDDNDSAYVFYASESNQTLYCIKLNSSYTDIEQPIVEGKTWSRAIPYGNREAPAPFKYKGRYYIITSGLTGWAPNPAEWAWTDTLMGTWHRMANPCVGPDAETTYQGQSTFVLQAPNKPDSCFIFMADIWNGSQLQKSSFLWLPFIINNNSISIYNLKNWNFYCFDNLLAPLKTPESKLRENNTLNWESVSGASGYSIYKNNQLIASTTNNYYTLPNELAGKAFNYSVGAFNISGNQSALSIPNLVEFNKPVEIQLSTLEPDEWQQGWGSLMKNQAMNLSPINIAGQIFEKGLGTHAYSEITYYLGGKYKTFSAFVGIDNYPQFCNCASASFIVKTDGKIVFQSKVMHTSDSALAININLKNVNRLTLIATDGGDGTHYDHVNWANAKLLP